MEQQLQAVTKLPLLATIAGAYRTTFAQLGAFGLVAAVWGALVFVALFAVHWLVWSPPEKFGVGSAVLQFATILPSALIGASAAVVWHRFVLRDEAVSVGRVFRVDGAVLRYAGMVLALLLVSILAGSILVVAMIVPMQTFASALSLNIEPSFFETPLATLLGLPALCLVLAPIALVAVRLMLRLPAIAVEDRGVMLHDVWQTTRGNSWRLYIGSLATIAPTQVGMLVGDLGAEDRLTASLSSAAVELIWLVAGLIFVTFMSLAYRHFFAAASSSA